MYIIRCFLFSFVLFVLWSQFKNWVGGQMIKYKFSQLILSMFQSWLLPYGKMKQKGSLYLVGLFFAIISQRISTLKIGSAGHIDVKVRSLQVALQIDSSHAVTLFFLTFILIISISPRISSYAPRKTPPYWSLWIKPQGTYFTLNNLLGSWKERQFTKMSNTFM